MVRHKWDWAVWGWPGRAYGIGGAPEVLEAWSRWELRQQIRWQHEVMMLISRVCSQFGSTRGLVQRLAASPACSRVFDTSVLFASSGDSSCDPLGSIGECNGELVATLNLAIVLFQRGGLWRLAGGRGPCWRWRGNRQAKAAL